MFEWIELAEWALSSSLMILAVAALRYLLRGRVALRLQYALWALVLVRLLMPVSVGESRMSVLNAVGEERAELYLWYTGDIGASVPAEPNPAAVTVEVAEDGPEPGVSIGPYDGEIPRNTTGIRLRPALEGIWLMGMAGMALWFMYVNCEFFIRLKRSRKAVEIPGCPLPVYVSDAVETPCLSGLFRPAVYVTSQAASGERVLKHVLAHEATHYRHRDHIWCALRCACLCLHWYNPLVWLAAVLSRRDGELACDEGVISRIGEAERGDYGRTLIGLTCERRDAGALFLTATTMTGSKGGIKERITLIAKKPRMAACTLAFALAAAAVAAGCAFTGAEADVPEAYLRPLAGEGEPEQAGVVNFEVELGEDIKGAALYIEGWHNGERAGGAATSLSGDVQSISILSDRFERDGRWTGGEFSIEAEGGNKLLLRDEFQLPGDAEYGSMSFISYGAAQAGEAIEIAPGEEYILAALQFARADRASHSFWTCEYFMKDPANMAKVDYMVVARVVFLDYDPTEEGGFEEAWRSGQEEEASNPPAEMPSPELPAPPDMPGVEGYISIEDTAGIRVRRYYRYYAGGGENLATLPEEDGAELARLLDGRELIGEWPACDPNPEDIITIYAGGEEYTIHLCCEAAMNGLGSAILDEDTLAAIAGIAARNHGIQE